MNIIKRRWASEIWQTGDVIIWYERSYPFSVTTSNDSILLREYVGMNLFLIWCNIAMQKSGSLSKRDHSSDIFYKSIWAIVPLMHQSKSKRYYNRAYLCSSYNIWFYLITIKRSEWSSHHYDFLGISSLNSDNFQGHLKSNKNKFGKIRDRVMRDDNFLLTTQKNWF